jgi:hypothetical protein
MRALLVALALICLPASARAEPTRLLLAVGARHGAADEAGLRYSNDDARRVRDVFVALGGVRAENAVLLSDPSLGRLRTVMDRLAERARAVPKNELTFVFYFSGHGDSRALHLAGEVMPISELSARIAAISAGLRIVITDACRTVRLKGASAERAFDVRLGAKQTATGTAWIHAAADGEAAQESDALGGAVFTHALVSGLRGAADRDADRRVTLAEAYTFAYHLTLYRSARAAGVLQRPAAALELEERAPVVLTETTRRSALLRLPAGADHQYLVYALGARAVVAETWGSRDRTSDLALAPGRYLIHRRGGGAGSSAAEVSIAEGGRRDLRADEFRAIRDEDLSKKGGTLILRPHALGLSYGPRAGSLIGVGHGGRVLYTHRLGDFALGGGFEGGLGASRAGDNDVDFAWLGGELRLEWRAELGRVDTRLGVRTVADYGWQTLTRREPERFQRAGYGTEQRFRGLAAGAGLVARALLPIEPWFIELGGTLDGLGALEGDRIQAQIAGGLEAGGGVTF